MDDLDKYRSSPPINWFKCVPRGMIGYDQFKREQLREAVRGRLEFDQRNGFVNEGYSVGILVPRKTKRL